MKFDTALSRRGFVQLAASGFVLSAAALLEACRPAAPSSPAAGRPTPGGSAPKSTDQGNYARGVLLPTRVPLEGFRPDLPGSDDGLIDSAFVNYPPNPAKSVAETPGRGGVVNVVTWTLNPPPTPMDSNAQWQAINQELGVTLKVDIHPSADYGTVKLPTMVAGEDLPDMLYMGAPVIPQLPTFFKTKMADLTPYLSGDAIKEYPNLANFPTIAWRQVIFNQAIYGVPVPYPLFLWVHWVHQDLLDREQLERPKNADEYRHLAQHFTRPNDGLWGLGSENNVGMGVTNGWITGIFGAPNAWHLDEASGKLTASLETEQYRAAVGYARDLWAAGVYHPNALQYNLVSARTDFAARKFAFRFDGFQQASTLFWDHSVTLDPPARPRIMSPFPAQDGAKPTFWANSGSLGYTVIKQAPPERIKEMLRILNWLAAPMGSAEYLLMRYGLKDVHWTPDDKGNPILNDRGRADVQIPLHYITQAPVAIYYPKDPGYAKIIQDAEKELFPYLSFNPTSGYYSQTSVSRIGALGRDLADRINDIVLGRQPMSFYDQVVREWREGGGDQIRAEYEQEFAAASG